ncbi:PRC and DUF2382 domain-containing protein [Streptomyces sp. LP11]|uniref:PRC and DUF2382 domain-containing protein n=1 Tax=Streptomyces pyxinicus TaxID=2970331 RepID=A0ABT2B9N2_9ACTN|nr:PRC and DUF2382 domain-containing protein [Streptomyces sp. LP11]MCS0605228.1 PRC and DUF2382 domain-containing protein [Streptomyces sp. LP11]
MISREQIPAVLDHPVHDQGGKKIGEAKHVFLDDTTGAPEWVSVKTGLFGTSETFVPIRDASLVDDHIEVPYTKSQVKDAPHVDVDAGGHLSETEEHQLYDYYHIDWGADYWSQGEQGDQSGRRGLADEGYEPGLDERGGTAGWAAGDATAAGTTGTAGAAGAMPGRDAGLRDDSADRYGQDAGEAMTRSEEHMRVGVERTEVGRARLRKYVVTEEEEHTVPLRHEELRVEREPITDANRDAALSGPDISEAEHEVILHEERAVVDTEAVPVERVRLTAEERTEPETVRGSVRKERITEEADEIADEDYGDDDRGMRP